MTELKNTLDMIRNVYPLDHEPDGWPAIRMQELTAMADEIVRLRTSAQWCLDMLEDSRNIGMVVTRLEEMRGPA